MAGKPPPYQNYAYPPPPPAGVNHTYIIQQPQQVYIHHPQSQSMSSGIASSLGSGLASAFRSGGQLAKGSGRTVSGAARSTGGAAASVVRSGGQIAGDMASGFKEQADKTATSPLLTCFMMNSGVQLMSKPGRGCLRCLPNGTLDGKGQFGQDYTAHWLVVNRWENKVVLRNGAYPQFHLANAAGNTLATGIGDAASVFKLHESFNHYVTLQHEMSGQYIGVDKQQNLAPAAHVTSGGENSLFEVHLAYSPIGHVYKPTH